MPFEVNFIRSNFPFVKMETFYNIKFVGPLYLR
jgi:hypothetical protein